MKRTEYDLTDLITSFSNYDQYVDIVCCWHSYFEGFVGQGDFDHYPRIKVSPERSITPDFVVTFDAYKLVGEICRLPNNPDGFCRSVGQAKGYLALGPEADVMLLLPHTTAKQSEKRMIDKGLLADEQVLVVSFVRNDGDAKPCWIFGRASELRDQSFRDDFLEDKSLHKILTEQMKTIPMPMRFLFEQRMKHPFMNDQPPPLYTACFLWQHVFNQIRSPEEILEQRIKKEPPVLETTVPEIVAICRKAGIKMESSWVKKALALLQDADLAESEDAKRYTIAHTKLRARRDGSRELRNLIAERLTKTNVADLAETGLVPGQLTLLDMDSSFTSHNDTG